MTSDSKNDWVFEFLANCCICAGLALFIYDGILATPPSLPMTELSRADFLIAVGLIPHLSKGIARLVHPMMTLA